MRKETLPVRNYRLEHFAIAIGIATLIVWLVAGCAETPTVEHRVTCSATFYCDDVPYHVSPSVACVDPREAEGLYRMRLDELTAPAQCLSKTFVVTCTPGDYCVPYE